MQDRYGVPEIFEKEAVGIVKYIYEDIKYVLKVPVVNFVFRTLALYEVFFSIAWSQVRNNMLTINMEKAADSLRFPHISANVPHIKWTRYFDSLTIQRIREIIFIFNYVNPKLLLVASAWAESLSNRPVIGYKSIEGCIAPGVSPNLPEINLVNINEAPERIRRLLLDIAAKHHAFDAASDFRALACYPEFLGISWNYLRPYVGSSEYNIISSDLKNKAIELAHEMPLSVTVDRETLKSTYSHSDIAGIMGIVSMFQSFIPGLIIDGEFFRRMIA